MCFVNAKRYKCPIINFYVFSVGHFYANITSTWNKRNTVLRYLIEDVSVDLELKGGEEAPAFFVTKNITLKLVDFQCFLFRFIHHNQNYLVRIGTSNLSSSFALF